jgi:lipoprotein-anchoring transpeptidase ErfK/SrfK
MRSTFVAAAAALAVALALPAPAGASPLTPPAYTYGEAEVERIPPQIVPYPNSLRAGTIVIATEERALYYIIDGEEAIRYVAGVGRPGFDWRGTHRISRKAEWPDWRPPAAMLKRRPDLPVHMEGGPDNPLGARALYLGNTLYRIHGSNEPESLGSAVSSGCIRLHNDDIIDLYDRVRVGTTVIVQ